MMSDKTYDAIHICSLLAVPILVFLAALVTIWDIPYGAQITATLSAVDALIGGIVLVAKKVYQKNQRQEKENE